LDYQTHYRGAKRGGICDETSYGKWLLKGLIPNLRLLKWLFGAPSPIDVFVVPLSLEKLRRESCQKNVCRAANVPEASIALWEKTRKEVFDAIKARVATGHKTLSRPGPWDQVSEEISSKMLAYVIAASPAVCCARAGITIEALASCKQRAESAGAKKDLERYLDSEGREYGLITAHLFVPTVMMLAFREEAKQANHGRPDVLARLPGFDQWFLDWTFPPLHSDRRQKLMRRFIRVGASLDLQIEHASHETQNKTKPRGGTRAADVRADKRADNKKKSRNHLPHNPDVLELARIINKEKSTGAPMKQIALGFTEGNEKMARSLLRGLRRFPHLLQ
jgi:hypothetical protein